MAHSADPLRTAARSSLEKLVRILRTRLCVMGMSWSRREFAPDLVTGAPRTSSAIDRQRSRQSAASRFSSSTAAELARTFAAAAGESVNVFCSSRARSTMTVVSCLQSGWRSVTGGLEREIRLSGREVIIGLSFRCGWTRGKGTGGEHALPCRTSRPSRSGAEASVRGGRGHSETGGLCRKMKAYQCCR
jgi:hypothetical protein